MGTYANTYFEDVKRGRGHVLRGTLWLQEYVMYRWRSEPDITPSGCHRCRRTAGRQISITESTSQPSRVNICIHCDLSPPFYPSEHPPQQPASSEVSFCWVVVVYVKTNFQRSLGPPTHSGPQSPLVVKQPWVCTSDFAEGMWRDGLVFIFKVLSRFPFLLCRERKYIPIQQAINYIHSLLHFPNGRKLTMSSK